MRMSKVRISVAVAAYNGERYIKEQIDSVLQNLSTCDEVVVSDDGSSDATPALVKAYETSKIPVYLVQGPKKGVKQNVGAALSHCRGDYIFLADQDDVWTKNKVEKVMEFLGKNGCTLVCHDARVMDASLTAEKMPSFFAYRGSKPGFWHNLIKNRYMGCCMAFDRRLLAYALPIPEEIEMHDQWIGMINDLKYGHSMFIKEPLLLYRRHGGNVSDFSHGTLLEMIKKRFVLFCAFAKRRMAWNKW